VSAAGVWRIKKNRVGVLAYLREGVREKNTKGKRKGVDEEVMQFNVGAGVYSEKRHCSRESGVIRAKRSCMGKEKWGMVRRTPIQTKLSARLN